MTINLNNSIYPCIWVNSQAAELAQFYTSIFPNSLILSQNPMVASFMLNDVKMMALNGNAKIKINPSISFFAQFDTVDEVKAVWEKLSENGKIMMPLDKYPWSEIYGWCEDKYGVGWQLMLCEPTDKGGRINPCLMFVQEKAGKAAEAIEYYQSIFKDFSLDGIAKYEEGDNDVTGYVKHAQFFLEGSKMMAMDSSGPHEFYFNEGISFVKECETQVDINYYWDKLSKDGAPGRCGWLKDKYGLSWQIIPKSLGKLMSDTEKGAARMQAMMTMNKIDMDMLLSI